MNKKGARWGPNIPFFLNWTQRANMLKSSRNRIKAKFQNDMFNGLQWIPAAVRLRSLV